MKKLALVALYVLSVVASFALGAHLALRNSWSAFNDHLQEAQAMLWFNHLLQFREIESDLTKGCKDEALEKARIAVDGEMKLLSSFHQESPRSPLNKYISDRDPKLLDELGSFKSRYGNSWTVPQCRR